MTAAAFVPIATRAGLTAAARAQAGGRVLQIDHIAIGDAAWTPDAAAVSLRNERARVPVARRRHVEGAVWEVAATVTGDGDYFAREVGFFADDEGEPVLLFVYAHAETVFAGVTEGQDTLFELQISLAAIPAGTVAFSFIDTDVTLSEALDDLRGRHSLGGDFNFGLPRDLKTWQIVEVEALEREAMIWRASGQSGITQMRHYGLGGDAAYHRPGAVSFAALGGHDHPEYQLVSGLPELQAVLNGYPVQTRHTDYRWLEAADDGYLANVAAPLPTLPPGVLGAADPDAQIAEMRAYYTAFAGKDPSVRDYRDHFDVHVAYLELWFEEVRDNGLIDAVHSFRHRFDVPDIDGMSARMAVRAMTGFKGVRENGAFLPRIVRRPDPGTGQARFAVVRYRVLTRRLGTWRDWPIDAMVSQVDDPMTRLRFQLADEALIDERQARFRVNNDIGDRTLRQRSAPGLLDRIMARIPGLDGPSAVIEELYRDGRTEQRVGAPGTQQPLNAARYSRFHVHKRDASGRRATRRGWNDPTLFVALTTRPEVAARTFGGRDYRVSYAIPLELAVAPPHVVWNPYDVAEAGTADEVAGDGDTPETAFTAAQIDGRWYRTPAKFFQGERDRDPATTDRVAWVLDGRGTPRRMRGSGIYIFAPRVAPDAPPARLRYPIAPVHGEGGPAYGYAEALAHEAGEFHAATAQALFGLSVRAGADRGRIEALEAEIARLKRTLAYTDEKAARDIDALSKRTTA